MVYYNVNSEPKSKHFPMQEQIYLKPLKIILYHILTQFSQLSPHSPKYLLMIIGKTPLDTTMSISFFIASKENHSGLNYVMPLWHYRGRGCRGEFNNLGKWVVLSTLSCHNRPTEPLVVTQLWHKKNKSNIVANGPVATWPFSIIFFGTNSHIYRRLVWR